MSVSLPNIAAFQAEGADLNKLRWIEDQRCWFWSDPSSSDAIDNVNIFAPSAGIGRIYRQKAVLSDAVNYLWQILSTPQTINVATNQAYINKSSTGNITFNLPASPTLGMRAKFKHLTSVPNLSVINRNGSNVQGLANNVTLTLPGTEAEFVYIDSAWGWDYVSNLPVRLGTATTALNWVSNRDTNGLFYHLGTKFGSAAWANPQIGATPECEVYYNNSGSGNSYLVKNNLFTDRDFTTTINILSNGVGSVYPIIYINLGIGTSKTFRLERIAYTYAANNGKLRTTLILGSNDNISYNSLSGFNGLIDNLYNWTLLKSYIEDSSFDGLTGVTEANLIVSASNYYKHFKIVFLTSTGYVFTGGTRNALSYYSTEIEMYGDLIR